MLLSRLVSRLQVTLELVELGVVRVEIGLLLRGLVFGLLELLQGVLALRVDTVEFGALRAKRISARGEKERKGENSQPPRAPSPWP